MISIRRGVFETNSSSMHSLVIKKHDDYPAIDVLEDEIGIYRIGRDTWADENNSNRINLDIHNNLEDLHFERYPFQVLSTFDDKLRYYIASECHTSEDIESVKNILADIFPDIKEVKFETRFNKDWGNGDYDQYGYAQNYGYFTTALKEKGITLKEFLTNRKYVIVVDGDEYQEFTKLLDANLVNTKTIAEIYTWPDGTCEHRTF